MRALERFEPMARTIAVTSGKGGVGKTNVAVNLGVTLAQRGHRVLLLDLDLGLANAQVVMGVKVYADIGDVVAGRARLGDALVRTPSGLDLVPGISGGARLEELDRRQRDLLLRLMRAMARRYEYVLIDTGAGLGVDTMRYVQWADEVLLVTTPEPTALLDAYALLKVAVHEERNRLFHLLVNQARNEREAALTIERLANIDRTSLHGRFTVTAHLGQDRRIGDAVRRRAPMVELFPGSSSAAAFRRLADDLAALGTAEVPVPTRFLERVARALLPAPV